MAKALYSAVVARVGTVQKLADIAEDQWGLVTRQQTEQAGLAWTTVARLASGQSVLERVAHGVYRLRGAPPVDHLELRSAWIQLAPATPVWERTPDQGVVSHRSAASVYGLGDLLSERHEFTLPGRRQSRRPDVRFHRAKLEHEEWISLQGLLVTRPSRIVTDLLADGEEPDAVAPIVVQTLRDFKDYPGTVAAAIAPLAARFGLRRNDGLALLRWLLELEQHPEMTVWLDEARASLHRRASGGGATDETQSAGSS